MSDVDVLETYLREIGVQTPVSLVRFGGQESADPKQVEADVLGAISEPKTLSGDMNSMDMQPMNLEQMAEAASQCRGCGLVESRQHVLFGQGNASADVVVVSGAPDSDEDEHGKLFVGDVEAIFHRMLMAIGLKQEQVYCLPIIQCMPPQQRHPKPDEVDACSIWVDGQLDKLSPKVIYVLGNVAAQALLKTDDGLNDLRGKWHSYRDIPVWVSYHPKAVLRSPKLKKQVWDDLLSLQTYL